jgi:hypothetical protein
LCPSCVAAASSGTGDDRHRHADGAAWATLERRLLAENVPACREFFQKYYDARGYLQAFLRCCANDGPDDAFENFNRWPELHALGADDTILQLYLKGWACSGNTPKRRPELSLRTFWISARELSPFNSARYHR